MLHWGPKHQHQQQQQHEIKASEKWKSRWTLSEICPCVSVWLLLLAISPFLLTHLIAEHPSTHAASFSLFWTPKQTHSHTRECGKKSTHQQGGLLRSFLRDGDVFLFFMKHLCIYIYFAWVFFFSFLPVASASCFFSRRSTEKRCSKWSMEKKKKHFLDGWIWG